MKKLFASAMMEEFVEGAARAVWVQWWADDQENRGKKFKHGVDLMDQAPATPLSAYVWAGELVGELKQLNKVHIAVLVERAREADNHAVDYREFGHYLAMQALGHGVSWFDDHAQFAIKLPHLEYYV